MSLRNTPLPEGDNPYILKTFLQQTKDALDTREFVPSTTGFTNVTSARGRYQRIGQLLYIHCVFEGTSIGVTSGTSYLELPIKTYTRQKNLDTTLLFPSSLFVFANPSGALIQHGHQIADTNRLTPDQNLTAGNGLVIQGVYWTTEN